MNKRAAEIPGNSQNKSAIIEINGVKLNSCESAILIKMERRYIFGEIGPDQLERFLVALGTYLEASREVRP